MDYSVQKLVIRVMAEKIEQLEDEVGRVKMSADNWEGMYRMVRDQLVKKHENRGPGRSKGSKNKRKGAK